MPTLLDAAGAKYPTEIDGQATTPLPGESLLGVFRGQRQDRTLFFEHEGHRAIRKGNHKLVAMRGGPWELYRIDRDRTEMDDLAADQPERVRKMAAEWDVWAEANYVTPRPGYYGDSVPAGPARKPPAR